MKNKTDLREYNVKDLKDRLQSEMTEYVKLKMDHAVSPLEDTSKLKKIRKEIARMHTELRRRELYEQK
ncbi:MAG: 50S ribosomal protein L29 [Prevotellaceae bacterium]|jgi:large subunit ribosomal protein L29|nr:50S ribosomal protein L29 [Prevotellaceae bacterium]